MAGFRGSGGVLDEDMVMSDGENERENESERGGERRTRERKKKKRNREKRKREKKEKEKEKGFFFLLETLSRWLQQQFSSEAMARANPASKVRCAG